MNLYSSNLVIERAQPWLGTIVSIRVEGPPLQQAHGAIDAAFGEIADVHRLMSFHNAESDVSRLNRHETGPPIAVHPLTLEVLEWALKFSAASCGCFDISVGAELVDWGLLPHPSAARYAAEGSWRDIEIQADGRIVFHHPLYIDLGGIAKGYAVDRATESLRAWGVMDSVVNAGGDIRVQGTTMEPIRLSIESFAGTMPVLELSDGSVAGSSSYRQQHSRDGRLCSPNVDGIRRAPVQADRFVCVLAECCVVADALTKIVMAQGLDSIGILQQFGATAHLHDALAGWQHLDIGLEAG